MPYRVSSDDHPYRPWTVIDTEAPSGFYVSDYTTAVEARAACERLNLEAAAHDLLAALERWESFACDNGWSEQDAPWLADTRAAIAKAKGN